MLFNTKQWDAKQQLETAAVNYEGDVPKGGGITPLNENSIFGRGEKIYLKS